MKMRIMFSLVCLIGVVCMAAMAGAGEVTWTILTHPSKVNAHPGNDGLMGTTDDVAGGDTRNFLGAFAVDLTEWGTPGPTCPANPGPDEVSYGAGTMKWCMGDPASGQVKWTAWNQNQTTIPQYGGLPYAYRLTPGGGPNTGSPCGTGTVNSVVDFDITIGSIVLTTFPDEPIAKRVFAVSDPNPGPITCNKVDGGTATYSTSDLNAIKALLPASATAYMVECYAGLQGPDVDACFNNMTIGVSVTHWTSGDVTACDGDCGGGGCMAGTAENVD